MKPSGKYKKILETLLKHIVMWIIFLVALFIGNKYYKKPDRSLIDNPLLVEQIAMNDALFFLEDKEFFLEYEICEPMDDEAVFKENLKPLLLFGGKDVTLYPTTYSVKVISLGGTFGSMFRSRPDYISCKARVYSKIMDDNTFVGLTSTGLVFSEPVNNKNTVNGLMQKIYPMEDSMDTRWIVILVGIVFLLFWYLFYKTI